MHLSPATLDRALAEDWFQRFEGAGLDGVMAKRLDEPYKPGQRTMIKVKHERTADCVVAGFRWHKNGAGTMVGSLLLGLYDDAGTLHHVGVDGGVHATPSASGWSTSWRRCGRTRSQATRGGAGPRQSAEARRRASACPARAAAGTAGRT